MKSHIQRIGYLATLMLSASAMMAQASVEPTFVAQTSAMKHATGLVRTSESVAFFKRSPKASFTTARSSLPKNHSLRGVAGPVEDQGQCGSCWDFSLTSVLRGSWIMAGSDPGRLSFNYLLNCATTSQGCNGGDFTAAEFLLAPKGAPSYGADGDYNGTAGTCMKTTPVASTASYKILGTDLGANPNAVLPSFKDIAYVVGILHRPVSIDINATDSFQSYVSGIYNDCTDPNVNNINHMVSVEGYDCETAVDSAGNCVFDANGNLPPGVGTWLIRNSWSDTWGDGGYITMKATDSKGVRCNSVASDALYFTVK